MNLDIIKAELKLLLNERQVTPYAYNVLKGLIKMIEDKGVN